MARVVMGVLLLRHQLGISRQRIDVCARLRRAPLLGRLQHEACCASAR
jgi:hypothetical protein